MVLGSIKKFTSVIKTAQGIEMHSSRKFIQDLCLSFLMSMFVQVEGILVCLLFFLCLPNLR